ncbi:MAG TPA: aquaporin [Gemmatimonadales bacterium]|nr:aquaporin [Gemmatimonadales bacterium]
MPSLSRRLLAEAIGTFGLIFIGCGVVVVNGGFPSSGIGLLGIAVAHALVLSVMITATMNISGGHHNPAVTIGVLSAGRMSVGDAVAYVVAQLVGAVIGALLVRLLLPAQYVVPAAVGVPVLADTMSVWAGMGLELVLTFFLVLAVFGTAIAPTAPKVGGFGIGLVLLFDILVGGPLTGGVMNPARAFGPAVAGGGWADQLVWWIGPIVGGIIAALVWEHWLMSPEAEA